MNEDDAKKFHYCLPYFYQPFEDAEIEQRTMVKISFPSEPPVVCDFNWTFEKLEARDARLKMIEEMSEETKEAFRNIKFYKFYPQLSPDVPRFKTSPCINRYYGNAHQVL
ncbi:hypothetical protein ISN44_As13g020310 [Arabidopsis suecica]|uniref:Uncharacterized protein n=1 Tax=Arabidopsis suecica TaxID=45249 RepID=A0A8T1Y1W6_ARASU|nr:hypothetical protein ISN44_As13g020310 [Arabidopsis suecica]